jgi:hypothetical protein
MFKYCVHVLRVLPCIHIYHPGLVNVNLVVGKTEVRLGFLRVLRFFFSVPFQ